MIKKVLVVVASLFLLTGVANAQFADVPHDKTTINIGLMGSADSTAINSTVVAPVKIDDFDGWAGLYILQNQAADEIVSQIMNAHVQGGVSLVESLKIKAFADWESNHEKGYDSRTRIGAFVTPMIYDDGKTIVTCGFGNFFEDKQVRDDLELTKSDPTVSRWLAYVSYHHGRFALLTRATPHLKLTDFQFTVEPSVHFGLTEKTSLDFRSILGYDSNPFAGEEITATYSMSLGISF